MTDTAKHPIERAEEKEIHAMFDNLRASGSL